MECTHCGRKVNPTVHIRNADSGYKVDYYILWTGDLEEVAIKNPRDESVTLEFYKLSNPRMVVTCSDCMKKSEVKARLDEMFSTVPEPLIRRME